MLRRWIIGVLLSLVVACPVWAGDWEEGARLFEEGQRLFTTSRFIEAKEKYEKTLLIFKRLENQQAIGAVLGNLGNVYLQLSDYHKANEYYKLALAIARKTGDEKIEGIWLGNLRSVYLNFGDYYKAIEYHKQALILDNKFGDIKGKGTNLGNIGNAYLHLGDYHKAIEYYKQALAIGRKIDDKIGEGNQLGNLSIAYSKQGEYQKAIPYYKQALDITREIGDKQGEGNQLGNLGITYYQLGDYRKAIKYYNLALTINKKIGDKKGEGIQLCNIGSTYADFGDYSKAIEYYEQALEIDKDIGNIKGMGADIGNLGSVYLQLGDYRKAIEYYEQALVITKKIRDIQGEGSILGNLGMVYGYLGDYVKAVEYQKRALATAQKIGDKLGESYILGNLCRTYFDLGNYFDSISYCSQALAICKKIGIPYDIHEGNLGDAYLSLGKDKEALKIYQKQDHPIRLGRYYLKKNDFQKAKLQFSRELKEAIERRIADFMLSGWIGLGLSCEGLQEYKDAKENYKKAVEFMEHQRESLPEVARTHFFAAKVYFPRIEAYEGLARVSEKLGRSKEAFFWAENTRARLLSEQIAGKHKAGSFQIPSDLAEKERELINKIASNYKQQEVAFQKKNKELLERLEQEIKPLRRQQKELITRLRRDYPRYASIRYPQPIQAEHIPLKENEVLIEYEVTEPYTLCMVVRNRKVEKIITISKTRKELEQIIKRFREPFEPGHGLIKFNQKRSHELYNLLLKDALADIPPESHLLIIPDEFLSLVPFGALALNIGEGNKPSSKLRYASDYWPISYYQSATVISLKRKLRQSRKAAKQLFALGDAIYGEEDVRSKTVLAMRGVKKKNRGILISSLDLAQKFGEKELGYNFSRLKNTQLEVKAVGKLFPESNLLLGPDASEENVKSTSLAQYRYLLFSTHGILGNDIPYIKEPALVLNLVGNKKEDGFLTMSEVFNLKIDADMVALSACQTGLGTQVAGEGLMGLSRAFMYAGTDTVIATLWSVADESTSKFMVKFFEGVKFGKDKLVALREAKIYLRNSGYDHPFYWAPFILIGEH